MALTPSSLRSALRPSLHLDKGRFRTSLSSVAAMRRVLPFAMSRPFARLPAAGSSSNATIPIHNHTTSPPSEKTSNIQHYFAFIKPGTEMGDFESLKDTLRSDTVEHPGYEIITIGPDGRPKDLHHGLNHHSSPAAEVPTKSSTLASFNSGQSVPESPRAVNPHTSPTPSTSQEMSPLPQEVSRTYSCLQLHTYFR